MNFTGNYLSSLSRTTVLSFHLAFPRKNYAAAETTAGGAMKKKKVGKLGPMIEKKVLPVETDVNKLVRFVCGSNIFKTGQDVEVKPDAEYPDWLWTIRTGPAVPLEELEPNSKEYWRRIRKMSLRRNNKLMQLRKL